VKEISPLRFSLVRLFRLQEAVLTTCGEANRNVYEGKDGWLPIRPLSTRLRAESNTETRSCTCIASFGVAHAKRPREQIWWSTPPFAFYLS